MAVESIGVSCGHRVPREPTFDGVRKLYWCAECGEHRMSGGRSTGERGHDWAIELREVVADLEDVEGRPLTITVEKPLSPHGQRLADSLGVRVEVKPVSVIDVQAATESRDCPVPGCAYEAEAGRTHCRHHRRLGEPVALASRRLDEVAAMPARRMQHPPRPRNPRWSREQIIEAIQAHAAEHGYPPTANEWVLRDDGRPCRGDVTSVFGSWANGVEAAGFPRPRRGVKPSLLKDSSSERAVDPEPEEGPRSPTPDAGGLDAQPPAMGARTQEATDAAGGPEPGPGLNRADLTAVRTAALHAVNAFFDSLEQVEQAVS